VITALSQRERRALPDLIAEQLLAAIAGGEYAPGDKLPTEHELSAMLGVGRTSLREAIQRLRTMGVLEVRKGLGTYVLDPAKTDAVSSFAAWSAANEFEVTELFEVRLSLETTAAALASERATREVISGLREAAGAHIEAVELQDLDQMVQTDQDFHSALVAAAGNSLLSRMYSLLEPSLVEYRTVSLALPGSAHRSGTTHQDIVDAITAHDRVRARSAVVTHLWTLYAEVASAASSRRADPRPIVDRALWDLSDLPEGSDRS
jgi:Transcriptional regulators